MKRAKDLYSGICDIQNIQFACKCASRGKKCRKSVMRVLQDEEHKLAVLQKHLLNHTYTPMPYTKKTIVDRCTNKIREIYVPKFYPDQIVQWALMLKLKPILLKGMYDYCCASVDGRGGTYGIKAIKKWLQHDKKNTKYCLIIDIRKYYPSIDQNLLIQKFKNKIKDPYALSLIEKIVYSVPQGLPIGNFTSQWFANFYLQDFDHYVKEQLKIKYYVRYMDDMIFLSSNKRKLHKQKESIEKYLTSEHLTIKPNYQIFKVANDKTSGRAIDYLGYKFYRNHTTMRGKTFLRMTRRIKKVSKKTYLTKKDACAIFSYNARIKPTSGNKLYNKYFKPNINLGKCRYSISTHDKLANLTKKTAL